MLVKGFSKIKEGEYQGHKYANVYVYGTLSDGTWTHEKVAKKVFDECGIYDINALIGNEANFWFDRYGKIQKITIEG